MSDGLPIIGIVIAGLLVVLVLLLVVLRSRIKQEEGKLGQPFFKNKKAFLVQFIMGLALALTGAIFMFDGDILGERTSGIATVIGIVGIGLIATSNVTLIGLRRRK